MTISSCGALARSAKNSACSDIRYVLTVHTRCIIWPFYSQVLQTLYHRRRRDAQCIVGDQEKAKVKIVKNCECKQIDFEWYVPLTFPG